MGEPVFSSCFNRETLVLTMMTLKRIATYESWLWEAGRFQAIPSFPLPSPIEFTQRRYVGRGWKWYFKLGNWDFWERWIKNFCRKTVTWTGRNIFVCYPRKFDSDLKIVIFEGEMGNRITLFLFEWNFETTSYRSRINFVYKFFSITEKRNRSREFRDFGF